MGSMVMTWWGYLFDGIPEDRSKAARMLAGVPSWETKDAIEALEKALRQETIPNVRDDILKALDSLRRSSTPLETAPYLKCKECGGILMGGTTKCPRCGSQKIIMVEVSPKPQPKSEPVQEPVKQKVIKVSPKPQPKSKPIQEPVKKKSVDSPAPAESVSESEMPDRGKASWFKRVFHGESQIRPLHIGEELLGRYAIRNELGEGTFGRVYLATDRQLKSEVAIKELRTRFLANTEAVNRFVNEARVARALQHPNIVVVYDLQPADVPRYIIMEYLTRGSLRHLIQKSGALPTEHAVQIAIAICNGLSQIHQKGIIHRDIKPENILFSEADIPKISDFGIAALPREVTAIGSNQSLKRHPGTLLYMSPEQLMGLQLDGRSDLYAVGVVLYEMLTGKLYLDISQCRIWDDFEHAILHQIPIPPSQRNPAVPSSLNKIVLTLLAKNQHERYLNAPDLIKALESFKENKDETLIRKEKAAKLFEQAKQCIYNRHWSWAFLYLMDCIANMSDHPGANALLNRAYCPHCQVFVHPLCSTTLEHATADKGYCPKCRTQLEIRV